jgi:hypothetical protein
VSSVYVWENTEVVGVEMEVEGAVLLLVAMLAGLWWEGKRSSCCFSTYSAKSLRAASPFRFSWGSCLPLLVMFGKDNLGRDGEKKVSGG